MAAGQDPDQDADQAVQRDGLDEGPAADEDLRGQLHESQSRHLRLAADFENYKKRVAQEQQELTRYAAAALANRLLPVLDDAERAMQNVPEGSDETWLRGLRLTLQQLRQALASVGVRTIDAQGAAFDPTVHEAIGTEESSDHPEGTVVQQLRPGYRIHDRVLRPALVKLARRPADRDGDTG